MFRKLFGLTKPQILETPEESETLKNHGKTYTPRLVVVDGLDECSSPELQILILQTIANAIPRLPIPLRFLIASRPETHIRTKINQLFSQIPLHRINLDDDQDIRKSLEAYYSDRFDEIRREHPSLRGQEVYANWPSQDNINFLISKSSTQFIFASTVMNYISHQRNHPVERLEVILGKMATPRDDRPFFTLDTLYSVILLGVDEGDRRIVRVILTFIYLAGKGEFPELNLQASPEFLEDFLGLRCGDVARLLDPLVSLLTLPETPSGMISMLHASFFDYFCDSDPGTGYAAWRGPGSDCCKTSLSIIDMESFQLDGDGSQSITTQAEAVLHHASLATASQRLILMLYYLQDYIIHHFADRLGTPRFTCVGRQNDIGRFLRQIRGLAYSKMGRANEMIVDSYIGEVFPSSYEPHDNMAALVVQHACHGTWQKDLTILLAQIRSAVTHRTSDVPPGWTSRKLSVRLCVPLIRQLLRMQVHDGKLLARKELIYILELPDRLGPWEAELAKDVLAYLNKIPVSDPSQKSLLALSKHYNEHMESVVRSRWESYANQIAR